MSQLVATAPFESSVTSYRGDLIVIVLAGVVSGVDVAVSGCFPVAGCVGCGAGVAVAGVAVVVVVAATFALVLPTGFVGAKKYDQPKRTAIDRTAAIKKREELVGLP